MYDKHCRRSPYHTFDSYLQSSQMPIGCLALLFWNLRIANFDLFQIVMGLICLDVENKFMLISTQFTGAISETTVVWNFYF